MDDELHQLIETDLAIKPCATRCPGCRRVIKTAESIAGFGISLPLEGVPKFGDNLFYPICCRCISKLSNQKFEARCARRVETDPITYTLSLGIASRSYDFGPFRAYVPFYGHYLRDPWVDDDRLWFEQNPSRSLRLREPDEQEREQVGSAIPADEVGAVAVTQMEPGVRNRAFIRHPFSKEQIAAFNACDDLVMQVLHAHRFVHAEVKV